MQNSESTFTDTLIDAWEIIYSGGWVMIPLFLLGLVAFYTGGRLLLFFSRGNHKKTSITTCEQWVSDPSKAQGTVGEIIRYSQDGVNSVEEIQDRFSEIRIAEIPRLQQNITFLQIMINTAPLMGLLGTVLGMLTTFYGIALGGSESTTSIVASGIQVALITTQMGLVLAIPGYFLTYYLKQKVLDYESFLVRLESISLQHFSGIQKG
ncbi:MotA/TolQ/ExbB proton channel family protein [Pelagicoccus mobilis]|uniref:MotA/TolQ/ExbB proton channel family protein n=1 Tax=Pelagicoccus mobilis TaxID=415221 RepID=A0A934RUE6_9BACT|nr:MotA/TolQ/ExbB proton channel family protein [Pelagicoccus mobilis]MBK1876611.1 MotA/TolQ/ExbB proton channel family protein [Pelagicoccus mobilis]